MFFGVCKCKSRETFGLKFQIFSAYKKIVFAFSACSTGSKYWLPQNFKIWIGLWTLWKIRSFTWWKKAKTAVIDGHFSQYERELESLQKLQRMNGFFEEHTMDAHARSMKTSRRHP